MRKFFGLNFLTGLLIGCAIAAAIGAAAVAYERYDTKTLKRTIRRDAVFCGVRTARVLQRRRQGQLVGI